MARVLVSVASVPGATVVANISVSNGASAALAVLMDEVETLVDLVSTVMTRLSS